MSSINAVAVKSPTLVTEAGEMTPEQQTLIRDVIAPKATPDELKLFLYRCKSLGLDPLKPGQIHFIKYGNSPGTIVVGIEGFRAKAHSSGKLTGIKRGVLRDDKGRCIGAWAEAYRSDWQQCAREEVSLAEYNTGKGPWSSMPETMIKKVAEAAVLRMAFPDSLGGIYVREEMDQAEHRSKADAGGNGVRPQQPEEGDGFPGDGSYRIPFGKYAKRSLEDIAISDLRDYVDYIERKAEKDGRPLQGQVLDFVERATAHIVAFENGAPA